MDNDEFRRGYDGAVAAAAGRSGFRVAGDVSVLARRDAQLDAMADLLTAHRPRRRPQAARRAAA